MSDPGEDPEQGEKFVSKMYIVVRQDLNAGYQLPQAIHAKDEFTHNFPEIEGKWYKESNTMVVLGVANEDELLRLDDAARELELRAAIFYEPDIETYTALAIEPGEKSAKLLCGLRPAGIGSGKSHKRRRRRR